MYIKIQLVILVVQTMALVCYRLRDDIAGWNPAESVYGFLL